MKRGVSTAILLVMLATVLAPLALASPASVPACCRAGGKHHCTMGTMGMDGFRSQACQCPYRFAPAVTTGIAALAAVHLPSSFFATRAKVVVVVAPDPVPVAFDLVQKRGPPLS